MKQSNCYLYEYENNRQVRNVGFVKYILEEDKITFQIHGKGMNCVKDEKYELYIFAGKSEACYVSRAGSVVTEQSRVNYMVTVEGLSQEQFNNYDGIYLHVSGEKKYVAMWNKSAVCFDRVESYDYLVADEPCEECCEECEVESHEEQCYDNSGREECHHQNHIHEETCNCNHEHHHDISHEEACDCNHECYERHHGEKEAYQEYHVDQSYEHNNHGDHSHHQNCDEDIEGPRDGDFQEEEERNTNITYEKIERQDIAKLPQREWKLANNSFLLHGYHNYQHILFIQEAGRSFIGVPGIYAPREADAAKNFGFPVFHRVGRRDMQWEEGEREYNVDFGYWCKEVSYHNRNH